MTGDAAEAIVYQTLMADPGVVAIIGAENAHENIIPESARLPAIAYTRSATEPYTTIHSSVVLGRSVTIEIACLGRSAKEARELSDSVREIVTPQWVEAGCVSAYNTETQLHEHIVTVIVTEE